MRFLLMTDIEGVTGITSYSQAENSRLGIDMLMHDLLSVIHGIQDNGSHEIVVYDMHTDGRNIEFSALPEDVVLIAGKPIDSQCYRGVGGHFDGLFLIGLHAMAGTSGAMLAHTYLREYAQLTLGGLPVGEIGMEAALAGEQGTPLVFVSGDDCSCAEAKALFPDIVTAEVKHSLGPEQALCFSPAKTGKSLRLAAQIAAERAHRLAPWKLPPATPISITFTDCPYLDTIRKLYPQGFISSHTLQMSGSSLLAAWSTYLHLEQRMISES